MKTQLYKVKLTQEVMQQAKPAQFVFESNDTGEVVGFVVEIAENVATIATFEPVDLPPNGEILQEIVEEQVIMDLFDKAMNANLEMKNEWIRFLNLPDSDVGS